MIPTIDKRSEQAANEFIIKEGLLLKGGDDLSGMMGSDISVSRLWHRLNGETNINYLITKFFEINSQIVLPPTQSVIAIDYKETTKLPLKASIYGTRLASTD
jgi:hypothetical protein